MRKILLGILLCIVVVPAFAMSGRLKAANYHTRSFEGRAYEVYRPHRRIMTTPHTLVVAFHGGGGSGERICGKMDWPAVRPGWFVACPDAWPDWNAREAGAVGWNEINNWPDDIGWLSRLIVEYLMPRYNIDRVILAGHSKGGGMAQSLICSDPSLADAVVVAGTSFRSLECPASVSTPMLYMNAVSYTWEYWPGRVSIGDGLMPYTCEAPGDWCRMEWTYPGLWMPGGRDGIEMWAARANCTGSTRYAEGDVTVETWAGCGNAIEVVETEGCHEWPGNALPPLPYEIELGCFAPEFPGSAWAADWIDAEVF